MKTTFCFILAVFTNFCCLLAQHPLKYYFPETPSSTQYQKDADQCYRLIEKQAHYLLTLVKPWHNNPDYKLTTASKGRAHEHIVRPNTGAVAIFSFLYRFGNYDASVVGVSRKQLLDETILPMMRYLVSVHKTGDKQFDGGGQWGNHWQSAHWVHQFAQGACSIWKDIPADLQQRILKMVQYEADIIAAKEPPYQLYYDSKSEENAWNAQALSAGIIMLPNHKNASTWEKALQKWLLSAYLCPNDSLSNKMVDGHPLKEQYGGANIFNDYTLENHGLVHPDYMTSCTLKSETIIDRLATGLPILDACMYNIDNLYDQLKKFMLPSTGFIYPTGQDWAIYRHADWANLHAFSLYSFKDGEALYWLRKNLNMIERMQARHADGRIYAENENFFPSSQTMAGLGLVDTWKMLMMAESVEERQPQRVISKLYKDSKLYIHRTPKAVHSISWGKNIQFQTVANAMDPIVAPEWHNGVGYIRLLNAKKDLPLAVKSIKIDSVKTGMIFNIVLNYGDAVKAEMTVKSMNNGDFTVNEKLTALRNIETEYVSTMLIGLLNHPEATTERGFRDLRIKRDLYQFKALSKSQQAIEGKEMTIDKRLQIITKKPFKGMYCGATEWKRSKLFDRIILNSISTPTKWSEGDILNDNCFTVRML